MPTTNPGALVPTVGTAGRSQELMRTVQQRLGLNPRQLGNLTPDDVRAMAQHAQHSAMQLAWAKEWDRNARKVMADTQKIEEMVAAFLKDASATVQDIAQKFAATNEEAALLRQKLEMIHATSETKMAGIDAESRGFVTHQQAVRASNLRSIGLKYQAMQRQLGRKEQFEANGIKSSDAIEADKLSLGSYVAGGDLEGGKYNPFAGALAGASRNLGRRPKTRYRRSRNDWAS